ncbi:cell division protein FtsN [Duganella sp. 1224]|uniref:SPOR domain-containing protein n=1 Tax=Duganella sp. 1224 TaxID=2587052 RepID=UPI0015CBADCF|nr:SPOR domain-containing protein [Duganella sp. 1224]NYE63828.1 cell division protein FtsN [Duganella sp. 1224]
MNFRSRFTPRSQQQGNTFIGIVIGLVIGLSIAVVVALMITKGSTPFTDKGHPGKATEPTAGQVADPNKPMYGNKDAAREAARDFAKDQQQPTAPAAPATPAPTAPTPHAADQLQAVVDKIQGTPATPAKPAATPNAANITPQPAAKPAAAADAGGDEKYLYLLQAGAFREIADAENVRAKLALLGFEANISDRTTDAGVLHRVQIGPYSQVETMNNVRRKLSENGVDVAVVRKQK